MDFIIFSLVRDIVLMIMKSQMFLTCLMFYWQTWIIQLYKHRNLKGSRTWPAQRGSHIISDWIKSKSPKQSSWWISVWISSSVHQTYLSRLFFVSPNFAVVQQYKTKTGFIKHPFVSLVHKPLKRYMKNTKKTAKLKENYKNKKSQLINFNQILSLVQLFFLLLLH